ncbi:hypothetical protein [Chitinophaga sp. RAB17]|uniref:hypothetical protein n=1 Tax=Chitinophaga sp. RAB17 TaxID=3233049 RepID=UPI003F936891
MRILVLEDDYNNIKGAFDYLNAKYYDGNIIIENYSKTQDLPGDLLVFDKIFVDISLQKSSTQDGYAFIRSILPSFDAKNIIIITGSDNVNQKIEEHNLGDIKILKKPISFLDVKNVLT